MEKEGGQTRLCGDSAGQEKANYWKCAGETLTPGHQHLGDVVVGEAGVLDGHVLRDEPELGVERVEDGDSGGDEQAKVNSLGGGNLLQKVRGGCDGNGLSADLEGVHRRALRLEVIAHHLLGSEEHQERVDAEDGPPGLDVLLAGDESHFAGAVYSEKRVDARTENSQDFLFFLFGD